MNRRNFLTSLAATVAGIALNEAIPFNRVWSFPKKIMIAKPPANSLALEKLGLDEMVGLGFTWDSYSAAMNTGFARKILSLSCKLRALPEIGAMLDWPTAAFPPDSSHTPS